MELYDMIMLLVMIIATIFNVTNMIAGLKHDRPLQFGIGLFSTMCGVLYFILIITGG